MAIATINSAIYSDLIGKPFKLGARGPDEFDCYGLIMTIMQRMDATVPDYRSPATITGVAAMVDEYVNFWTKCDEQTGSVAVIRIGREPSHVGFVLPFGKMIHCWERTGGVCIESLDEWRKRIIGFYKFPQ